VGGWWDIDLFPDVEATVGSRGKKERRLPSAGPGRKRNIGLPDLGLQKNGSFNEGNDWTEMEDSKDLKKWVGRGGLKIRRL